MKYNFIETDDLYKTILDINNLSEKDLNIDFDFSVNDEVFLNFQDKLLHHKDKKFLIVGDYDCDGICATTIIKRLFNHLGIVSNHYIPSRIKEGYGLNNSIVETAKENNFDCIITVDNGIVAYDQIKLASSYGIKTFIIDHHEYEKLPECEAIIHSNIVSDKFKDLSAGGLSFVLSKLFYEDEMSLVLGGLTTISDMMSVIGFNRFLINEMLNRINNINQMILLNDGKKIIYRDISFNIVPKINAVSRMEPDGNPNYLVKFFNDDEFSKNYISKLNYLNEERKLLTKSMSSAAYRLIEENKGIMVISSKEFKEGLCGLIANRLLHEFNKPIIVLSQNENGELKGSGRAPEGINLFELIKNFDGYKAFGGHEGAIGLTISEDKLADFKDFISKIEINNDFPKDVILLEKEMLTEETLKVLDTLKPFGTGLKDPLLAFKNENYKKIIVSERFPKYLVSQNLSAISFNENFKRLNPDVFIGRLNKDNYRPKNLCFTIEDVV